MSSPKVLAQCSGTLYTTIVQHFLNAEHHPRPIKTSKKIDRSDNITMGKSPDPGQVILLNISGSLRTCAKCDVVEILG